MSEPAQSGLVMRELFLSTFLGDARGIAWAIRRIVTAMKDVYLAAGETIYRAGDPPLSLHFIVEGEIVLSAPGALPRVVKDRALVGMFDVALERPRTRTATAALPTHLLEIRGDEWQAVLKDSFAFAQRAVLSVADRVHELRRRPPPLGSFGPPSGALAARGPPLDVVDRILLLREIPLFRRAGTEALATLATLADERRLDAGAHLVRWGMRPSCLFVVASGEVEATLGGPELAARFRAGSLVCGSIAVDANIPYDARATSASAVVSVAIEDYFDVMEEQFDVAQSAMRAIIEEYELMLNRE